MLAVSVAYAYRVEIKTWVGCHHLSSIPKEPTFLQASVTPEFKRCQYVAHPTYQTPSATAFQRVKTDCDRSICYVVHSIIANEGKYKHSMGIFGVEGNVTVRSYIALLGLICLHINCAMVSQLVRRWAILCRYIKCVNRSTVNTYMNGKCTTCFCIYSLKVKLNRVIKFATE